ncbi:phage holin family protein [Enterobacter hormaechei]
MVTSDRSAMANGIISAVIVIALMFYQRGGGSNCRVVSVLAYLPVGGYGRVPFRYLFGLYNERHGVGVRVNVLNFAPLIQ